MTKYCIILGLLLCSYQYSNKMVGVWKLNDVFEGMTCGSMPGLSDSVTFFDPFGKFDSTLILFDNFTFENGRGHSGQWYFKIYSVDTLTEEKFYLVLDSTKYECIITDTTLWLTRHYGNIGEYYHWTYAYGLIKK